MKADRVAEEVLRRPAFPPASGVSPAQDASGRLRKCGCEAGKGQAGTCDQCRRQTALHQTAETAESSLHSPDVDSVVRSPGQPLAHPTRTFMEARFGHDFARVRVHADEPAARSAHGIGARAYTLDQHIVFARGEFSPATTAGQRLLAHELVHTIQQTGASSRQNAAHETTPEAGGSPGLAPNPLHLQQASGRRVMRDIMKSRNATNHKFDTYNITGRDLSDPDVLKRLNGLSEQGLVEYRAEVRDPEVKAYIARLLLERPHAWGSEYGRKPEEAFASARTGGEAVFQSTTTGNPNAIPAPISISMKSLKTIFPDLAKDITPADTDVKKDRAGKAEIYLKNLNDAFKIMKIDTIQAQADYLAHAFVESDQFRAFTETQGVVKSVDQKWMDDPFKVRLAADIGKDPRTGALTPQYRPGSDINPGGKFEFVGRGPVQVTNKKNYREVIAELDRAAAFYLKQNDNESFQAARQAADAISAHPEYAADPRFTFLASAALMKYLGGDRKRSGGPDAPIQAGDWVGGAKKGFIKDSPQEKRLGTKTAVYKTAFCVLLQDAKAENPKLLVPADVDKSCGSPTAGAASGAAKKP